MFVILINNQPLQTYIGEVYKYANNKEAVKVVEMCYGLSAFKKFCKLKKLK